MGLLSKAAGLLFGGSENKQDPASVWGAQQPFLTNLWEQSQTAAQNPYGQSFAQGFQQPAQGGFNQLLQGGYQTPGLMQGLQGFGGQQNEALGGAIQAGLGDINQNLQRNILPSISQGAAMSGTSGGSRQGIAEGLALSDANRQASDFVNRMRSENFQQGQQNQLQAYGQMGDLQGQQNAALMGGLGMAPELSNLGFGSQYGNLFALSQLLGSPTVLSGGGTATQQRGLTQGFNDIFGGGGMMSMFGG